MRKIPKGAMFCLYQTYYKVGVHNKIFRWDGDEWILSFKTHDDVAYDLNLYANKKPKECYVINAFYKGQLKPVAEKLVKQG